MAKVEIINVFSAGIGGGNPAPVVMDANGMTDLDMQAVAKTTGHESVFVFSPAHDDHADFAFRFWVPQHEMEMCGHATVAATWLLAQSGRLKGDHIAIRTKSGLVEAQVRRSGADIGVEISQPAGRLQGIAEGMVERILSVLGISEDQLAPFPLQNAATSRTKTLIPLSSVEMLTHLRPQLSMVEQLCEDLNSTGLYPYAVKDLDAQVFEARQFPKSSGYPEDAATGIAAAALTFGLLANGLLSAPERIVTIHQGFVMGRPSEIKVRLQFDGSNATGCWLAGKAERLGHAAGQVR